MTDAGSRAELKDAPVHVHCIANCQVSAFIYRWRRDVLGMDKVKARAEMEVIWYRRASGRRLPVARPVPRARLCTRHRDIERVQSPQAPPARASGRPGTTGNRSKSIPRTRSRR